MDFDKTASLRLLGSALATLMTIAAVFGCGSDDSEPSGSAATGGSSVMLTLTDHPMIIEL